MMKPVRLFPLLGILLIPSLVNGQSKYISRQLTLKWETPATLKTPESVCFDVSANVLYVSNINGKADEKDGNGFISKVSLEGEIKNLHWVDGLDAPKGMGIYRGKLFVANIKEVVEISILTGKILNRYPASESVFLNDITVGPTGTVYVSDTRTGIVYHLKEGRLIKLLDGFDSPNGLLYEEGKLLVGTKNAIFTVDLLTLKRTVLLPETGLIDGIAMVKKDTYLYSDWAGSVHRGIVGKPAELLLNTTPDKVNAADIWFIPSKNLLLVPTFNDNRVVAYELKTN